MSLSTYLDRFMGRNATGRKKHEQELKKKEEQEKKKKKKEEKKKKKNKKTKRENGDTDATAAATSTAAADDNGSDGGGGVRGERGPRGQPCHVEVQRSRRRRRRRLSALPRLHRRDGPLRVCHLDGTVCQRHRTHFPACECGGKGWLSTG